MHRRYDRTSREAVVIVAVVVGHVLLILLWEQGKRSVDQARALTDSIPESGLLVVPVTRELDDKTLSDHRRDDSRVPELTTSLPQPRLPALPATESPDPATPPRSIDWRNEAARAARSTVNAITETPQERSFGPKPAQPATAAPKQFEWHPEPPRAGFSGLLPYVRLGKRCILGLGFFGCAFGELPPADGTLFQGMDHPDRPRSSVPQTAATPP